MLHSYCVVDGVLYHSNASVGTLLGIVESRLGLRLNTQMVDQANIMVSQDVRISCNLGAAKVLDKLAHLLPRGKRLKLEIYNEKVFHRDVSRVEEVCVAEPVFERSPVSCAS